ncbi:MAG: response regulator [Bdellovibrionales bacterium]|nr:response regulator [Bdellovibrionales bacterium]
MVGSHTDITKRKQAESEKEAQKETAMIQSRLASIGELSAGVGHEINNPLTIALGSLYGLKEQIKKPEECKPFQRLGEALDRIRDITNGLRVMARHDKKKELVNMNKSVEDSLNFVNEIYKREGVEITSEYKSQPAQALICRSEVQQVLLNLLSNAKDACADCPEKRILVSVLEENGSVKIMVKDNGFGIPQEIQSRIFDQFYTTKASGKGTGLGLSISNNIVRDQVGKLHFDSELNKGTAFYIELPTIASEESSSPFKMDQEAVGPDFSKKVRLLVVDDEPEILEIFKTCLSPLNCDVEFASNGPQALRLLQADDKSYDFVISDIRMPGMSGFELRASLVKNSKSEQVPRFIFVSGGSNFDFAFSAHLEEDAMDIIYKPFNSEDIVNSINVAIDQLAKDEASIHAG